MYISKQFSNPITEITSIAKKMANLDFSHKYEVKDDDEINELGASINVMSDKLEKARKIDGSSLETKVRLFYAQFMTMNVDENNKRNPIAVKEIRETLENACEELSNAGYLRTYLGDIENLEGNTEAATKWYKQALKIEPDNITAKRQLMLIEERQQKPAKEAPTSFLDKLKALFNKKL